MGPLELRLDEVSLVKSTNTVSGQLRKENQERLERAGIEIIEGAVGMVEHALEELASKEVVALDEARKAAMVSNLLVVLCSETETQPIISATAA